MQYFLIFVERVFYMKLVDRDVNLNNYVIFYVVAKLKSFTLASNELYISQPAVSVAVRQLEESLSVKLIYRDKGNVKLTRVGEEVLDYVEKALNNFNMIKENVIKYNYFETGNICIGVPAHVHNGFLFKYIDSFLKIYQNITIQFKTGNINSLIDKMQLHEIDFVVDEFPKSCNYNNIKVVFLKEYNKGFIFNKKFFPELVDKEFDLSILEKYRLILPLKDNFYRKEFDDLVYDNDIEINTIDVNNTSEMYKYVDNGLGLGYFITDFVLDSEKYGILNIRDVNLKYNLCLMYIEDYVSLISEKLIGFILEMSKDEENIK